MSDAPGKQYPDLKELLARKAAGRRARAQLSFAEKLDALDKLRDRLAPIERSRKQSSKAPRPSRVP